MLRSFLSALFFSIGVIGLVDSLHAATNDNALWDDVSALYDRLKEVGPNLIQKNEAYFKKCLASLEDLQKRFLDRDEQRKKVYSCVAKKLTGLRSQLLELQDTKSQLMLHYTQSKLGVQVEIDALVTSTNDQISSLKDEIVALELLIENLKKNIATVNDVSTERITDALQEYFALQQDYYAMTVNREQCLADVYSFIDGAIASNYDFSHETDNLEASYCSHKKQDNNDIQGSEQEEDNQSS